LQADESGQRWLIPALAPGQTATLSGVASNAGRGARAFAGVRPFNTIDFNDANDRISIDVGPALAGTADLQIQSLVVNPGANSGSSVLRATLVNAGPAAAQADTANPIYVRVNVGLNFVSAARALSDGWDCTGYGPYYAVCKSSVPFAAGASAVIEFDMSAEGSRASVEVKGTLTPDPLPANDIRYVDLPKP
ncbi:MAG TPA: hypothetical protein VK524_10670, partial [Polyangiaceae bacterium]|nr:hypothetical protein [Polyangiaceae bacterium]